MTQTAKRAFTLWLVATLKGGTRKTTTAMLLAFELADRGHTVLVIDADYGSQGVTDWGTLVYANGGELPFDVVQWTPSLGLLVAYVQQQAKESGADYVILDIGGEAPEVLKQAIVIADRVLSPVGPEQAEMDRLPATHALVPSGVRHDVLLTRVPAPGRGAAREARAYITEEQKLNVLETEIEHNRERYSDIWGTVPASRGAYAPLADELLKEAS